GAMTMGFMLPARGLPGGLSVGDTVTFSVQETSDGVYRITAIAKVGGTR
ncbi:hypothetical protein D3872_03370, partial [Massilia cavernae]